MSNNIQTLSFNNTPVFFTNDAYLNATAIAAHFNKKPIEWLRLPSTEEYITALCKKQEVGKSHFLKTTRGKGKNGTWLHRRLAVPFARWLNVEFAIWCDEQIENILYNKQRPALSTKTTVNDRTGLRQAVSALVGKHGIDYDVAYRMIHQRFNVEHIDELTTAQVPEAIAYVQSLMLVNPHVALPPLDTVPVDTITLKSLFNFVFVAKR